MTEPKEPSTGIETRMIEREKTQEAVFRDIIRRVREEARYNAIHECLLLAEESTETIHAKDARDVIRKRIQDLLEEK